MDLILDIVSPISPIALGFIALVFLIPVGSITVWWLKNVLRHRLPRPFLGDGANVEWAELKRAELAAGGQVFETGDASALDSNPESAVSNGCQTSPFSSRFIANERDASHRFDNGASQEHLLQAWPSETGHADKWAEKLLGDLGESE